ncbi:MAG TPA: choice-of-anchor Q domain-containing protein, partial [Phototrophicaceae bacterium]|nr:choice-of-anchor Q domain-containing protein [Phototrophicaceae bacterium]
CGTLLVLLGLLIFTPILATSGIVTDCSSFKDFVTGDGADTLGELISTGGNITFACSGILIVPERIVVTANTRLDATGQTVTLDAQSTNAIFGVYPGVTLELIGLTISGGSSLPNGGSIRNGGTLILTDAAVANSCAANPCSGAGIHNIATGTITLTNSVVSGNEGGGILNEGGIVTLIDSTVSGNRGRGLTNEVNGTMTLTRSTVADNTFLGSLTTSGNGIANSGRLIITDSTIARNTTAYGGGGIYNDKGIVEITNSTLTGNANLEHPGGAISNFAGSVTLSNCVISDNYATSGGAIANDIPAGTVTISNCLLTSNWTNYSNNLDNGGTISNSGTFTLTNSTIANSTGSHGGAIYNSYGTLTVINSTLSGNTARKEGGGILMDTGNLTLINTTITGSVATIRGAGLYITRGATTNMTNSIIANSQSGDCIQNGGTITLTEKNLIEDGSCGATLSGDPLLDPLADNGGPTLTHALQYGSPALNAVTENCLATDQRGLTRPRGNGCDLGAFESGFSVVTSLPDAVLQKNFFLTSTPILTWNPVSWATGYTLQISDSPTFGVSGYNYTADVGANSRSYTIPSDPPLAEDITYYWRVCAKRNATTCGGWSTVESFVIDAP